MRRLSVVLLTLLLVAGLGMGAAFAYCGCSSTCGGGNCDYIGKGGCWQTLYHRCDGGDCGNYDPFADDCQYKCDWKNYYCEHVTSYDEFCITS